MAHHNPIKNICEHLETKNIVGHDLFSESYLDEGTCLASQNGAFYAVMQHDGNFVLYVGTHHQPKHALWSSKTNGKGHGPYCLAMQNDGNLVVYDGAEKAHWDSHTYNHGTGPYRCVVENNGDLVVYDSAGTKLWHSNTGC